MLTFAAVEMIWTTIVHRPYVVAFLFTFLILAILHLGVVRALCWLLFGYLIAFVSEYSSIRNGIPYGTYHYLYDAMKGELILGGVPVWDSLSYVFIAYASFAFAWYLTERLERQGKYENFLVPARPWKLTLVASILMMLADVIIDPVANLGERWFLGKVYFYPEPGVYFGVPLSNFAGWFVVALGIIGGFQIVEKFLLRRWRIPAWGARRFAYQAWLGPLFYFGILGFNLAITFSIQEYQLGIVGCWIALCLLLWTLTKQQPNSV